MRNWKYILLIVWVLLGEAIQGELHAKTMGKDTLSAEVQQQFLYYFYVAQHLIQKEEIEQAWELMQFCYELNPNDATVNNYMGIFLKTFGQDKEAIKYLQRAFILQPKEYWYHYSLELLQSENKRAIKLAINNLEDVAAVDKKNEELHTLLQKAYIHVKDYKRALLLQDRLDSITGYNAMSAMQRYRLNAIMKNNSQAIYEVERFLEEEPDNVQFQVFRLQLYEQTGQPSKKMIEAYSALLQFDPRNWMLMNNLAWHLCISGGDLERAEYLSRQTIMAEPSNPTFLDTYAWILYNKGEYHTAFEYIRIALEKATLEAKKEITEHYNAILKKLEL